MVFLAKECVSGYCAVQGLTFHKVESPTQTKMNLPSVLHSNESYEALFPYSTAV